ncbi:phosphoribosylformylglycinamidine cyclo-ligase [Andreesenia angusta]|uniref:Phosphoribosylformylglycinamidine cyclo-ligase n=2 Tax=Andreesenia angusta TaxID=39480 RepID=A0A1S1V8I7_9FIRM|nr:phosphoribosylformylglycinamidine cyclo-ligase [Andreesenia angusta]OHW62710.1 phosphoribosylformylglycinamidine cyclo-ligase [Andreesenia angusta]
MVKEKLSYRDSGVDIEEGARAVEMMKSHVKSTYSEDVLCDIGGFGGLFSLNLKGIENPVLVSGTDGVGTKLKLAFMAEKHDTVGIDLVGMCVNDILCQGARPLFFLDYLATGKLEAGKVSEIVGGIADGCNQAGMALIGGETAEMPGFYTEGEYDLAGFAVGIVDRDKIVDGRDIVDGDVLIGLPSSGIHSNGYSLVREIFLNRGNCDLNEYSESLGGTLGEVLLRPTRIYVKPVLDVLDKFKVKGMVHVTGGGFYENIPRVLPENMGAEITLGSWDVPEIFGEVKRMGNINEDEMYRTFNMGIGYILFVEPGIKKAVIESLEDMGECSYEIGKVRAGIDGVKLCQG